MLQVAPATMASRPTTKPKQGITYTTSMGVRPAQRRSTLHTLPSSSSWQPTTTTSTTEKPIRPHRASISGGTVSIPNFPPHRSSISGGSTAPNFPPHRASISGGFPPHRASISGGFPTNSRSNSLIAVHSGHGVAGKPLIHFAAPLATLGSGDFDQVDLSNENNKIIQLADPKHEIPKYAAAGATASDAYGVNSASLHSASFDDGSVLTGKRLLGVESDVGSVSNPLPKKGTAGLLVLELETNLDSLEGGNWDPEGDSEAARPDTFPKKATSPYPAKTPSSQPATPSIFGTFPMGQISFEKAQPSSVPHSPVTARRRQISGPTSPQTSKSGQDSPAANLGESSVRRFFTGDKPKSRGLNWASLTDTLHRTLSESLQDLAASTSEKPRASKQNVGRHMSSLAGMSGGFMYTYSPAGSLSDVSQASKDPPEVPTRLQKSPAGPSPSPLRPESATPISRLSDADPISGVGDSAEAADQSFSPIEPVVPTFIQKIGSLAVHDIAGIVEGLRESVDAQSGTLVVLLKERDALRAQVHLNKAKLKAVERGEVFPEVDPDDEVLSDMDDYARPPGPGSVASQGRLVLENSHPVVAPRKKPTAFLDV
eukprot:comp17886_c0_seq1/m.18117 comp17886_c0_seq1/g.18117  ORF comp17886_c0_seq1/g.18117 comp17886_c0_seq1/m.18117 type:complete len:599 (-) comp17886_c0_seq1:340-2136(-)